AMWPSWSTCSASPRPCPSPPIAASRYFPRAGGWPDVSPEAHAAADTFSALHGDLADVLANCASGQELIAAG
ncbi:MAG: hypothetical protein WCC65_15670, partial [Pseudonocardiaceae bacterium]